MIKPSDMKFLVVGADSLIGSSMIAFFKKMGLSVMGTSRRKGNDRENNIRLDLNDDMSEAIVLSDFSCAFFCAGITNMTVCEKNTKNTHLVNVTNTLKLAKRLHNAGTKIVYLSSNTVFDGKIFKPDEHTAYCPSTEYGRQKMTVEKELLSLNAEAGKIAIVRLTKVVSSRAGVAANCLKYLMASEPCPVFNDLRISPVSLSYVLESLFSISTSEYTGIFHLSGTEEMTYSEFAMRLASYLGVGTALVRTVSSKNACIDLLFKPKHPALGMKRTSELLRITPEPTFDMLKQIAEGN